ncbi:MAG TPA: sporulation protein [Firmicutes bacterium]|nr:sporulation protein [Bacillota bacterium]
MKNKWLSQLIPKVEILVPTLMEVNELRRRGVQVYGMKKYEEGYLVIISRRASHRFEQYVVRRTLSIYRPFLKIGAPILVICVLLMITMNSITINYKINGNLNTKEVEELNELLEPHFYNVGPFAFLKTDTEIINAQLHEYYNEFVWINIYRKGTDIVFDVYDMPGVERNEDLSLSDTLYAKKSGVVQGYNVESCRVLVERNQFVKVGDPLVTCNVEQPYTNEVIPIDDKPIGEVYADTWYEVTVTAQKNYVEETFTTKKEERLVIHLGNWELKFPFGDISFEKFEERSKKIDPFFFMDESPFYIEKKHYYEKSDIIITNTYEDIKANLHIWIENSFKQQIDDEFTIKKLEIISEEDRENEIVFKCHLTLYENIAN